MRSDELKFDCTKPEAESIARLARRSVDMGIHKNMLDADMDITVVHCNGCPLDLERMEKAGDGDFAHDAAGIRRHLDRETGKLMNCFLPRFAVNSAAKAFLKAIDRANGGSWDGTVQK